MTNSSSLSEFINDVFRILIIAKSLNDVKSVKLTEYKIMQCDYYLKFPRSMFGSDISEDTFKENFNEYYAFYHWKPDIIAYKNVLRYLLAKELISKTLSTTSVVIYSITDKGIEAIDALKNDYKTHLLGLSEKMVSKIKKLSSDTAIDNDIHDRTSLLSRKLEVTL